MLTVVQGRGNVTSSGPARLISTQKALRAHEVSSYMVTCLLIVWYIAL